VTSLLVEVEEYITGGAPKVKTPPYANAKRKSGSEHINFTNAHIAVLPARECPELQHILLL